MSNKNLLAALKKARADIKVSPSPKAVKATRIKPTKAKKTKSATTTRPVVPTSTHAFNIPDDLYQKLDQLSGTDWTPEGILQQLSTVMPNVYPELRLADKMLCRSNIYRAYRRNGDALLIDSGQSQYRLTVKTTGNEYKHWLDYFNQKAVADPATSAKEMCVYELEAFVMGFEDYKEGAWSKVLSAKDYQLLS